MLEKQDIIHFNEDTFEIMQGVYKYSDIVKCSILNEDAAFKGKSKPFVHTSLGGTTFLSGALEPKLYVGIKITFKNGDVAYMYISKEKVLFNSDAYLKDVAYAKKVVQRLEKKRMLFSLSE